MKKVNKIPIILFFVTLAVLLAVSVTGLTAGKPAKAYTDPLYAFGVSEYNLVYDIGSDCNIAVTEDITINYKGSNSTGFIRDIPVNGGVQIRNVQVCKLVNGEEQNVWYDVYSEDNNFLSIDIGDDTYKKGKSESYRINYNYIITNSVVNKSMLPLNAVGHGWDCALNNVTVKLVLPEGYKGAKCYVGAVGTKIEYTDFDDTEKQNGRRIITAEFGTLDGAGVTFDLTFENGAIKNYTDIAPYAFTLAGLAVLALIALLKLFVFGKNYITPVVNYEAPNKMDPLLMGKLIDNSVNSEDVTSLIFYWASKGYIKINLDDKNDPTLIRIMQALPEPVPSYERLMYNNLFASGDVVKISSLKNKFYTTVTQVTNIVNKRTKGLYTSASQTVAFIFALIGGLLMGLAPFMLALIRISVKYLNLASFIAIIPMVVAFGLTQNIVNNRLKYSKNKILLNCLLIALVCAVTALIYVFLVPSEIMSVGAKIALVAVSSFISSLSAILITRTKQYTEQLNDIIGFKNFITLAEKPQLEMLLEDDPQFYYNILPYAQVLGVTDKWEDKFKDITVAPPQWLTGDFVTTYFEFRIINGMLRTSMTAMTAGMVSRPSSSGVNGGGKGGFGGGFSGGGFGGGGGRGR